jgi:hypothetical protein
VVAGRGPHLRVGHGCGQREGDGGPCCRLGGAGHSPARRVQVPGGCDQRPGAARCVSGGGTQRSEGSVPRWAIDCAWAGCLRWGDVVCHRLLTIRVIFVRILRCSRLTNQLIGRRPPNGWCEPRPPAPAGEMPWNYRHLCRQDTPQKSARVGVGSTQCWAALVRPEADTRHELGKCNAKRWAVPTYRL